MQAENWCKKCMQFSRKLKQKLFVRNLAESTLCNFCKDSVYSCLRDCLGMRGAQLGVPLELHGSMVLRGLRGHSIWIPLCREAWASRTVDANFSSLAAVTPLVLLHFLTGNATPMRRIAVRETGVSRHHGGQLEPPEITRTSQHYCIERFSGDPQLWPTDSQCKFFFSACEAHTLQVAHIGFRYSLTNIGTRRCCV